MPKEYIEREVALNKIKKLQKTDPATVGKKQFSEGYFCGLDEAEIVLLQTPTADVAEVKHGKWIKHKLNQKAVEEYNKMKVGKKLMATVYIGLVLAVTVGVSLYKNIVQFAVQK